MTHPYTLCVRRRFDSTIRTLCTLIEERVNTRAAFRWTEHDLRIELVGCILGSQVRHEMGVAATENLMYAGLLNEAYWLNCEHEDFECRVQEVLSGQVQDLPHNGSYRFPQIRAKQLADVRNALARTPLTNRLENNDSSKKMRKTLVADLPGLGPKQASMFLRNIGRSYNLAVLDTHVLRFMSMQRLLSIDRTRINTITGYEKTEAVVVRYAESLGYQAGYLDWAIWATMKAAREIRL